MREVRVFVDSDVVISSLISSTGAAYLLLTNTKAAYFISDLSKIEIEEVVKRLTLNLKSLKNLIRQSIKVIKLTKFPKEFTEYVFDLDDAHIIAGAKKAKVKFLITYNLRHFKIDRIKADLGIIILTPADFLQYLRSR